MNNIPATFTIGEPCKHEVVEHGSDHSCKYCRAQLKVWKTTTFWPFVKLLRRENEQPRFEYRIIAPMGALSIVKDAGNLSNIPAFGQLSELK